MTAGLAIVTYNRPAFCERTVKAVAKHLPVSHVVLVNDGSDAKHDGSYKRVYKALYGTFPDAQVFAIENQGVAAAKNVGLDYLLRRTNCEWLFVLEDDILVTSPAAVTEYIRVGKARDMHHLSFAHHGPANESGPVATIGDVAFYPHSIGAWTMFSRDCLLRVGLFDENMHNAFEHVEHELRLIAAGFMPGAAAMRYPDVVGSQAWLKELPGSIEKSSIRPRPDWAANIRESLRYWRDAKPDTYGQLFGPGTQLEGYAQHVLGDYSS